jgi:predicted ABC-type ATPase
MNTKLLSAPTTPKIVIIAGPNGAGKTTFAREFLPHEANCPDFINADLIAAGLSPFKPEAAAFRAGRLMLQEIHEKVRQQKSFAFETTLSGRTYLKLLQKCRNNGYHIMLIFLSLPTADMAATRVAARVIQGGHNVPELDIRRRFKAGLNNFHKVYKQIADVWTLYDNSGTIPTILDQGEN